MDSELDLAGATTHRSAIKFVKIHRASKIVAILVIAAVAISTIYWWNLSIKVDAEERERHFISMYYLAMEDVSERESDESPSFESLVRDYGGTSGALAKPFRHGLVYHIRDGTFSLEEPKPDFVSLFRKDRLVSTGLKRPYWETTGKLATK